MVLRFGLARWTRFQITRYSRSVGSRSAKGNGEPSLITEYEQGGDKMRFCPYCRRINEGWPEICRFCAHTWSVARCRSGHINPPGTVFRGECGSVELSSPSGSGGLLNKIFQFPKLLRKLLKFTLYLAPMLILILVIANFERLLPVLAVLLGLLFILHIMAGLIPSWMVKPVFKALGLIRKARESRALQHDSRGRRR